MSERPASVPGMDPDLAIDFPRPLKGPSTQHQLLTLLVDYWFKSEEWLPSRLIAALAAGLGITASASATALSRLASRGVLEQSSAGRTSRYRITQGARKRLRHGLEQVSVFGEQSRHWDGNWTVIAFSIPETSRDVREMFRSRLRWRGFAPLFGALWVSPRDHAEELENTCKGYGVDDYVIFRTDESSIRGKRLVEAWSPQEFKEQYRPFTEKFTPWAERLDAGTVGPAEAFRVRTELMDAWRAFPWSDPDLPAELLPEAWPRTEARDLLVPPLRRARGRRHCLRRGGRGPGSSRAGGNGAGPVGNIRALTLCGVTARRPPNGSRPAGHRRRQTVRRTSGSGPSVPGRHG